jgi:hypothetical protein
MTVKIKFVIIGTLVLVLAIFFYGWHLGSSKAKKASISAQTALNHEITTLTVRLNDTEYYLTKAEQEVGNLKKAIKEGLVEKETLRKLNLKQANEISKLKFQIDTLLKDIDHDGTVVIVHDTITKEPKNALLLPFTFGKQDEWLDFKGNFDSKGKLDMTLKMKVVVDVVTGIDKTTKRNTINILSDNTYLTAIDVKSWKTDVAKPKRYGVGIQTGYGFILGNPVKTAPYIGLGISYNFIRF